MKKSVFGVLLYLIILASAAVMGCATATPSVLSTVYQEQSVPWQEHALLLVYPAGGSNLIYVNKLDGIRVKKGYGMDIPFNKVGVIPSGNHTVNVVINHIDPPYSAIKRYDIAYEFQAGGRYVVFGDIEYATGPLGRLGENFMKIVPLDEFRAEWEASRLRNRDGKNDDAEYKAQVLDKFSAAEAELNKAAAEQSQN